MPTSPSVRRRFGSFAVAVALLALQLTPVVAAEITTDLWVYQTGDTVTVTGVDYAPDETVEIVTTDPNAVEVDRGPAQTDLYGGFTVRLRPDLRRRGYLRRRRYRPFLGPERRHAVRPSFLECHLAAAGWKRTVAGAIDVGVSGTYTCSGTNGNARCSSPASILLEAFPSNNANNTVAGSAVASVTILTPATPWSGTFAFRTVPGAGQFAIPTDGLYDVRATFTFTGPQSPDMAVADDYFGVDNTAPTIPTHTITPSNPAPSGWYNVSTGAPSVATRGRHVRCFQLRDRSAAGVVLEWRGSEQDCHSDGQRGQYLFLHMVEH